MQYQPPRGPVVGTGAVGFGGLAAMHHVLLAVTILFTLFIAVRLTRRGARRAQR